MPKAHLTLPSTAWKKHLFLTPPPPPPPPPPPSSTTTTTTTTIRAVAETEEVGNEIIEELGKNREKIESTQDKVKQVNADMDVAKATVKRMNDREKRCCIS